MTVTLVTCNDRYMLSRKSQLEDAALKYLLQHGVAKLSLRPLAAHLGTSPRMLLFYFKSKEGLLQDLLGELQNRMIASFKEMALSDVGPNPSPLLRRFWEWATNKKNFPYVRLLYELHIIAAQNPAEYGGYLKKISAEWQAMTLKFLSDSIRTEPMATLCIAVFDGLFIELMSTGDRARLTRAIDHFISLSRKAAKQDQRKRFNPARVRG